MYIHIARWREGRSSDNLALVPRDYRVSEVIILSVGPNFAAITFYQPTWAPFPFEYLVIRASMNPGSGHETE